MGFPARMPATTSSPWALVRYSPVTTLSPVKGLRVKQTPVAPSSPRLPKIMETTLTAETAVSGILFTRRQKLAARVLGEGLAGDLEDGVLVLPGEVLEVLELQTRDVFDAPLLQHGLPERFQVCLVVYSESYVRELLGEAQVAVPGEAPVAALAG